MNAETLRRRIRAAIELEWPAFAAKHPQLAEVIDEDLMLRQSVTRLADDEGFKAAIRAADAAGATVNMVIELIRPAIRRLFKEFA